MPHYNRNTMTIMIKVCTMFKFTEEMGIYFEVEAVRI